MTTVGHRHDRPDHAPLPVATEPRARTSGDSPSVGARAGSTVAATVAAAARPFVEERVA